MANSDRRILLTGATGFLGHYVLAEILARKEVACRLLVRMSPDAAKSRLSALVAPLGVNLRAHLASGRVEVVAGRLPEEIGGDALAGVDQIIHAAASTSFRRQGDEPYRSNVDGTQALLDAAKRADIRRFCFISTAYVGGMSHGQVPETLIDVPCPTANDYEKSKLLAEMLVWNWADGGRSATIVRPSILIGDRQTGRATSFGGIYLLARTVELLARAVAQDRTVNRYCIPLRIMGDPRVRPNLIPVCWAAKRIVEIALEHEKSVRVHNLVNPDPPTSAEIKAWLEDFFDLAGGVFTPLVWPWVAPSSFEEGFYASGQSVLEYFRRDLSFDPRYQFCNKSDDPLVDKAHFFNCVQYACSNNWGRASSTSPKPSRFPRFLDTAWYFEKFLTQKLPQSKASQVSGLTAVVRFVVEGLHGGAWTCCYEHGRLVEIRSGTTPLQEHFGFRVQKQAFDRIVRGESRLQDAYFAGEANIIGNVLTAMKMVPVMEMFLEEFPVKSAA